MRVPAVARMSAVLAVVLAMATPAAAATVHGLVFDDINGDGKPSAGEAGVAGAVVALGTGAFTTTDASGQFDLTVPDGTTGIVWVRVPEGFTPGPVWGRWDGARPADIDLALRRLPADQLGRPLTFVVAADTHIAFSQDHVTAADLARAAAAAVALDPPPAFFTILGDITQGNRPAEFALLDAAIGGLGVPFVPVAGNHDWYDEGQAWFAHYGPDNYSFDIGGAHVLVWNMALPEDELRRYLAAELSRVPRSMPVIALTHAPPSEPIVDVLRELGVDYVLTGHAHSNRVVDHDGVIELNTEPFVMGGLDFTPAGYRVLTLDGGRLGTYHRTTVDTSQLAVLSPSRDGCTPARGARLLVAAELDASETNVTATIDCGTPLALRPVGGWNHEIELPALGGGLHTLTVTAASRSLGLRVTTTTTFTTCESSTRAPVFGEDWPQLGGGPAHHGVRAHEVAPPLTARWVVSAGGHVLTAPPVIAGGRVFVATTDLGDGDTGGVVALDLATGAQHWRVTTRKPVRGGIAVESDTVVVPQIDGVVLGLDAITGAERWRHELSTGVPAEAGALFGAPTVEHGDAIVGHQRALAALAVNAGAPVWTDAPVPDGADSQSAAAVAIGEGLVVGTFNRALGGVIAWDRARGTRQWSVVDAGTVAINASPLITRDAIYVVTGADVVTAYDLAGLVRWRVTLDPEGFDWGNATIGTPALAGGVLVVPTLYRDLVALDAATGAELWRHAAAPGPLRTTHYRGGGEAGFAASPVITGDIVWAVDTGGQLTAHELRSGKVLWRTPLGVPVLAGLAVSGDHLVIASYDGSVRALVPRGRGPRPSPASRAPSCAAAPPAGGCCDAGDRGGATRVALCLFVTALWWRRRAGGGSR